MIAAPAAAGAAAPAKGGPGSTTTTTTKPGSSGGSSSSAFATLLIKPASIGHVSVETAGTTTFQPGTNNEQLHVGDTVQTDSVGLAEIDYASNAYTRLNVNTTFTIKKLTDNQGDRQIDGGLTSGETWNRTSQLTQSESFQQDGGGVSAAVSGTAFVVDCTTTTQCTFTAVIDNTNLTVPNGQTQTLNPLTQCVTQNAALCASPSMLTPDQVALIQWIQYNVFLDLVEHGIGNGIFDPFGGTATVTNGVVTITPSTSTPTFTPSTSPPGTPPPSIDPTDPIVLGTGFTPAAADPCDTFAPGPSDTIAMGDDCAVNFTLNASGATAVVFLLPADLAPNQLAQILDVTQGSAIVVPNVAYGAQDTFQLMALDIGNTDVGTTSFQYAALGPGGVSTSNPIHVAIQCDGDETCGGAASASTAVVPTPSTPSSPSPGSTTVSSTPTSTTPSTPSSTSATAAPGTTSTPATTATGSSS